MEAHLTARTVEKGGLCLKLGFGGLPDRIVLLPGGRVGFAELKAPGQKPRKLQRYWLTKLAALGFPTAAPDSIAAAEAFVAEVGKHG